MAESENIIWENEIYSIDKKYAENKTLRTYVKEQLAEKGISERWDLALAGVWDKSDRTARKVLGKQKNRENNGYREYLLETAVFLRLNLSETDKFLKNIGQTGGIYTKNPVDAAYYHLLCNMEEIESNTNTRRGKDESIAEWVRRILPSFFLDEKADQLDDWLNEFFKKKGRKWDMKAIRALAGDIGIDSDILNRSLRRCLTDNREMALAIAVSSKMSIDEINEFFSMCSGFSEVNLDDPLDYLYLETLGKPENIANDENKREDKEPILAQARSLNKDLFEKEIKNTTYYDNELKKSGIDEAIETGNSITVIKQQCEKTLPFFIEWVEGTWLEKNAGNSRYNGMFKPQETKKEWDNIRHIIEEGEHPVTRDQLIKIGLMLKMYPGKMNEILKAAGYIELQDKSGHIYENYLYAEWNEIMKDKDTNDFVYPKNSKGDLPKHMPDAGISDADGHEIKDLRVYFSEIIDEKLKPERDVIEEAETNKKKLLDVTKAIRFDMMYPPEWYVPKEKRKTNNMLKIDGIVQVIKEYHKILQSEDEEDEIEQEQRKISEIVNERVDKNLKDGRKSIYAVEVINYKLEGWGFDEILDYDSKRDQQVINKINELNLDDSKSYLGKSKLIELRTEINKIYQHFGERIEK